MDQREGDGRGSPPEGPEGGRWEGVERWEGGERRITSVQPDEADSTEHQHTEGVSHRVQEECKVEDESVIRNDVVVCSAEECLNIINMQNIHVLIPTHLPRLLQGSKTRTQCQVVQQKYICPNFTQKMINIGIQSLGCHHLVIIEMSTIARKCPNNRTVTG
jgi:hypothetical protein